jgi:hypothetical protein
VRKWIAKCLLIVVAGMAGMLVRWGKKLRATAYPADEVGP